MEHLENPGRWVSLHEKITDWEWFKGEMHHFKVFVYLLLKANYKDGSWRGVEIKRGQRITGLKSLSEDTGVSINKLRIILRDLKSTGEITIKSTNKYSIITVTNYEKYQNAQSVDHRPDHKQITNKSQTDHKQITTNNKENKYNNEHKENNRKRDAPIPLGVEAFKKILPEINAYALPTAARMTEKGLLNIIEDWGVVETKYQIENVHNYIEKIGKPDVYKSIDAAVRSYLRMEEKRNGGTTNRKHDKSRRVSAGRIEAQVQGPLDITIPT